MGSVQRARQTTFCASLRVDSRRVLPLARLPEPQGLAAGHVASDYPAGSVLRKISVFGSVGWTVAAPSAAGARKKSPGLKLTLAQEAPPESTVTMENFPSMQAGTGEESGSFSTLKYGHSAITPLFT